MTGFAMALTRETVAQRGQTRTRLTPRYRGTLMAMAYGTTSPKMRRIFSWRTKTTMGTASMTRLRQAQDSTSPPQIGALIHSTPIRMETDSAMAAIRSLASAQGVRTQSPSIQTSRWTVITISWLIKLILHGRPSMGTRMQMMTAMVTLTAWNTNVTHPH